MKPAPTTPTKIHGECERPKHFTPTFTADDMSRDPLESIASAFLSPHEWHGTANIMNEKQGK